MFAKGNNWIPSDSFDCRLTDDQLKTRFFRYFTQMGTTYYKDVRVPRLVTLRLRDELAAAPPRVYDVFAGRELRWEKAHALTLLTYKFIN